MVTVNRNNSCFTIAFSIQEVKRDAPPQSSLAYLQGKRARIFIDDNAPGQSAAERWAAQLQEADIVVDGFSFTGLLQADGQPVKDLNDLLKIDYDCWEQFRSHIENIVNFAP
jgi:hypothetical protein